MNANERVGLVFFGTIAVVSAVLLFIPAIWEVDAAGRWTTGLGIPFGVLIVLTLIFSLAILGAWFRGYRSRRK